LDEQRQAAVSTERRDSLEVLAGTHPDQVPLLELVCTLRSFARRTRSSAHRCTTASTRQIILRCADIADSQAEDLEQLAVHRMQVAADPP
jgi:hypothetical protein